MERILGPNWEVEIQLENECAFYHENGHWKKDCSKAKKKDGKKPEVANMAHNNKNCDYSLSFILAAYMASLNECILDIEATYHCVS